MSEGSLHGWFSIQHFRHLFDTHQDLIVFVASTNRATPINIRVIDGRVYKKETCQSSNKKNENYFRQQQKNSRVNSLFRTKNKALVHPGLS